MRNTLKIIFVTITISLILSCKTRKISNENITVLATIDSVSVYELSQNFENKEIFWLYNNFDFTDPSIFSQKFSGPVDYTDFDYSEALTFEISVKPNNVLSKHLADQNFKNYFSFEEHENIEIILRLDKKAELEVFPNSTVDAILSSDDTLLNPLKFSLINGNVNSKQAFKDFGRVKNLEIYVNNTSKGIVKLLDTPYIQEFKINGVFKRDDTIILKPLSFYKGEKYDSVCISEIKKCLNIFIHPNIDKKYEYHDVLEKLSVLRKKK